MSNAATTPIAAGITVHSTDAEDVEVLIKECVAVTVQTYECENRVGDGLGERQRLTAGTTQSDNISARRAVVDHAASVGRATVITAAAGVLIVVGAPAGLVEPNAVGVGVGAGDGRCGGGDW